MSQVKIVKIPGYAQETYDIESVRLWLFSMGSDSSIFVGSKQVMTFEELQKIAAEHPEQVLEVLIVAAVEGG